MEVTSWMLDFLLQVAKLIDQMSWRQKRVSFQRLWQVFSFVIARFHSQQQLSQAMNNWFFIMQYHIFAVIEYLLVIHKPSNYEVILSFANLQTFANACERLCKRYLCAIFFATFHLIPSINLSRWFDENGDASVVFIMHFLKCFIILPFMRACAFVGAHWHHNFSSQIQKHPELMQSDKCNLHCKSAFNSLPTDPFLAELEQTKIASFSVPTNNKICIC